MIRFEGWVAADRPEPEIQRNVLGQRIRPGPRLAPEATLFIFDAEVVVVEGRLDFPEPQSIIGRYQAGDRVSFCDLKKFQPHWLADVGCLVTLFALSAAMLVWAIRLGRSLAGTPEGRWLLIGFCVVIAIALVAYFAALSGVKDQRSIPDKLVHLTWEGSGGPIPWLGLHAADWDTVKGLLRERGLIVTETPT
jgi:hypothetical protein